MQIDFIHFKERGNAALPPVYAFDSSEVEKWDDNVKFPAFEIVESFLKVHFILLERNLLKFSFKTSFLWF